MRRWIARLSAVALGAAVPLAAWAAYSYVASSVGHTNTLSGTPDPDITFGASVPVGALPFTCGISFGENSNGVPDDTNSNSYSAFGADADDGGGTSGNCWFAINNTNNAPTVTQHWTGTTDNTFSVVFAFSGNAMSAVLVDHSVKALPSGTSQTCNPVTPGAAGQLVVAFIGATNDATSITEGSGFTELFEEPSFHQVEVEYETAPDTSAISPAVTFGSATTGLCVVGVFALPPVPGIANLVGGKLLRPPGGLAR